VNHEDHERIDELLVGYVLLSLEGEDAAEADRLLAEHVPACARCRETLTAFQSVAGELALAASPSPVPDLVLPRIRHGIADVPIRRRRSAGMVAIAASVAALVGMAGLSLSLGSRVTKAEAQRGRALDALTAMQDPAANPVPLTAQSDSTPGGLVEISGPGMEELYLVGRDVPMPSSGNAYQLWVGSAGTYVPVGMPFLPDEGVVLLALTVDPAVYDAVLITEEPIGSLPSVPTPEGGYTWLADLAV
jgi:hypothetical protein